MDVCFTGNTIIMEVENGCTWKVTTIGGTHFSLPWLWEEGEKLPQNSTKTRVLKEVPFIFVEHMYGYVWYIHLHSPKNIKCRYIYDIHWAFGYTYIIYIYISIYIHISLDIPWPFVAQFPTLSTRTPCCELFAQQDIKVHRPMPFEWLWLQGRDTEGGNGGKDRRDPGPWNWRFRPSKMDGWKMNFPFGMAYVQGRTVSFKEGDTHEILPWGYTPLLGGRFKHFLFAPRYLGRWSILTSIFQPNFQ